MNGAVHGVESTAVMTPNKNDPNHESCFGFTLYTTFGKANRKKSTHANCHDANEYAPRIMVNAGYWKSWLIAVKPALISCNGSSKKQNPQVPSHRASSKFRGCKVFLRFPSTCTEPHNFNWNNREERKVLSSKENRHPLQQAISRIETPTGPSLHQV